MTRQAYADNQFQEGLQKIIDYARDRAKQEGIDLTSVVLDHGRPVGCLDYHLIDIAVGECLVSVKLHHNEIEDYPGHAGIEFTHSKIKAALSRLLCCCGVQS
jgi:hypothetical protein